MTMWRAAYAVPSRFAHRCAAQPIVALACSSITSRGTDAAAANYNSSHYLRTFSSQGNRADYLCVHVFVSVKPGSEDDFLQASLENARASSLEEGIARFDVIQQEDDPTKFVLVEVYKNGDAPAAHKGTNHYAQWRKRVEHMMDEPRKAIKYKNLFPATRDGWDYGADANLE
jgi:autoinducer 2-degrading protein